MLQGVYARHIAECMPKAQGIYDVKNRNRFVVENFVKDNASRTSTLIMGYAQHGIVRKLFGLYLLLMHGGCPSQCDMFLHLENMHIREQIVEVRLNLRLVRDVIEQRRDGSCELFTENEMLAESGCVSNYVYINAKKPGHLSNKWLSLASYYTY